MDPEAQEFLSSHFEDSQVENEEDWIDDQETTIVTQGQPNKMPEAMAIEVRLPCLANFFFDPTLSQRPSWVPDPTDVPRTSASATVTRRVRANLGCNIPAPPQHGADATLQLTAESVAASGK